MASTPSTASDRGITTGADPLALELPQCERGIGIVIQSPDSKDLIQGVRINPFSVWPDDRGYFLEVTRIKEGLPADFPPESTQVSAALSYPGTIKALHYHLHQTDLWVPAQGMFQVALVDLRSESEPSASATPSTWVRCGPGES